MTCIAIVLAAGSGVRCGGAVPKQYLPFAEEPILMRSLRAFCAHQAVDAILPVIRRQDVSLYEAVQSDCKHNKILPYVFGGDFRQQSAYFALVALKTLSPMRVLIHDAARPFVSDSVISGVIGAIASNRCALPAIPSRDSVRLRNPDGTSTVVDRSSVFQVQTPQGFMYEEILQAHTHAAQQDLAHFTDDASLFEQFGGEVRLVDGCEKNIKITLASDIA